MAKKDHVSETPATAFLKANKVAFSGHPYALPRIAINGGRRGYLVGIDPRECVRLLDAKPVNCALAE